MNVLPAIIGHLEAALELAKNEQRVQQILCEIEEARKGAPSSDWADLCPNCVTPWKCNGPHFDVLADPNFEALYESFPTWPEYVSFLDRVGAR